MKIKKFKISEPDENINKWMSEVDVHKVKATEKYIVITYSVKKEAPIAPEFTIQDGG